MQKKALQTSKAPAAIGPYSQAVWIGDMLFSSGQIPINPATGELVTGSIKEQCTQVMENLKAVLEEADLTFDNVIKAGIFCKNMDDFGSINEVYASYLREPFPARSTVEVARLPKDVDVEIDIVAHR